jgi:hypothetical protein
MGKKNVLLLINKIGGSTFTERIQSFIKQLWPEKHVSSITFRSCLPSIIWNNGLGLNTMTMQDFLHDYTILNNTSVKVQLNELII